MKKQKTGGYDAWKGTGSGDPDLAFRARNIWEALAHVATAPSDGVEITMHEDGSWVEMRTIDGRPDSQRRHPRGEPFPATKKTQGEP